jgi:prevent-host-death family protein
MEATMTTITVTDARSKLYKLVDQAREESEPILITGKRGNVVLVSEDDWRAIQETLHLLSIPGMRESIIEGMAESVDECAEEPGW